MQQSNTYVLVFAAVMTAVLAGVMSTTSLVLKPLQDRNIELDTKKKILGAVMDISSYEEPEQILALYDERVKSEVVNVKGEVVAADKDGNEIVAEKIDIGKNDKIDAEDRFYPVFKFMSEDGERIDSYIFPMFGRGLWDWISCYIALESDLNTVRGIAFDHKQETPGLGARITEEAVYTRYSGKKIYQGDELVSVTMVKGEGNSGLSEHQVDGMSGATMTANGVNDMLEDYFQDYRAYFEKVKSTSSSKNSKTAAL